MRASTPSFIVSGTCLAAISKHRVKRSLGRHRTRQTKSCLSRDKTRIMVFKLIKAAEKNWLRLRGRNQLPKLITGVKFIDGDEVAPLTSDANKDAA